MEQDASQPLAKGLIRQCFLIKLAQKHIDAVGAEALTNQNQNHIGVIDLTSHIPKIMKK